MKIAIHHREGSFSGRWITYCEKKGIPYKLVDCFGTDIVDNLKDCDALMWHYHHANYKDRLVASNVLFSLEHAGVHVFPDIKSSWHFDDKVAQKYLLEAIEAPLVPSYVFYDKKEAMAWAKNTTFPKVFKLKGGAGSKNVLLVKNLNECIRLINRAFNRGFSQYTIKNAVKDDLLRYQKTKKPVNLLKAVGRFVIKPEYAKLQSREKGYVYFQDFVENDGYDMRISVIGDRAVAVKRLVRENDFRASGAGNAVYEFENFDKRYIETAFKIADKLKGQSISMDFIKDKRDGNILIVEISYGFPLRFLDHAMGYWDRHVVWHEEAFCPQEWMVSDLVARIEKG